MDKPRYETRVITFEEIVIYGIVENGDDAFPEFIKLNEFKKFLSLEGIERFREFYNPRIYSGFFFPENVKKVLEWLEKKGCKAPEKK